MDYATKLSDLVTRIDYATDVMWYFWFHSETAREFGLKAFYEALDDYNAIKDELDALRQK